MITQKTTLNFISKIIKTRRTSTKLVVTAVALLLLVTTIAAITQRESPPVTRVRVCVKDNGQMRMVVGNTTCDTSERLVEWVVGGEVTDIQLGQGLVGSREDGSVQLAVDPDLIRSCTSCDGGRVFAGFDDGPRDMPLLDFFTGTPPPQIAKLDLPAGDYAIFAKMSLDNLSQGATPKFVICRLEAGADFDEATVDLESGPAVPTEEGVSRLGLTLQVVHHFDDPGSAD